ncbi:MAG TPA: septal ring lytic transglycosylase RlpA family protein [Candidatus Binatia bacterium]
MRTDLTLLRLWVKHRSIAGRKSLLTMLLSLLFICYSYDALSDSSQDTRLASITSVPLPQEEELQTARAPAENKPKKHRSWRAKLTESGKASWYGRGFHGKPTASGEVFDQRLMTAAHKTLPLGSRARVINLKNGNSVEVTINDRGPFEPGRIIDLSRAAAGELGILESGLAQVRIELLEVSTS